MWNTGGSIWPAGALFQSFEHGRGGALGARAEACPLQLAANRVGAAFRIQILVGPLGHRRLLLRAAETFKGRFGLTERTGPDLEINSAGAQAADGFGGFGGASSAPEIGQSPAG